MEIRTCMNTQEYTKYLKYNIEQREISLFHFFHDRKNMNLHKICYFSDRRKKFKR